MFQTNCLPDPPRLYFADLLYYLYSKYCLLTGNHVRSKTMIRRCIHWATWRLEPFQKIQHQNSVGSCKKSKSHIAHAMLCCIVRISTDVCLFIHCVSASTFKFQTLKVSNKTSLTGQVNANGGIWWDEWMDVMWCDDLLLNLTESSINHQYCVVNHQCCVVRQSSMLCGATIYCWIINQSSIYPIYSDLKLFQEKNSSSRRPNLNLHGTFVNFITISIMIVITLLSKWSSLSTVL